MIMMSAGRIFGVLLFLLLGLVADLTDVDICSLGDLDVSNIDSDALSESLHTNSIPRAGKRSGHFNKVPEIHDRIDCIVVCCAQDTCDVVLFFNETCYMIECNASVPQGCDPVERANITSTMVIVRQPKYLRSFETLTSPAEEKIFQGLSCEYGLQECGPNENCVLREDSPSRIGTCECKLGYRRGTDHVCVGTDIVHSLTPEPKVRGDQQTGTKTTEKTPTPSVTKLTVSAGEGKVIQLPENSVTLSAFVLPIKLNMMLTTIMNGHHWPSLKGPRTLPQWKEKTQTLSSFPTLLTEQTGQSVTDRAHKKTLNKTT